MREVTPAFLLSTPAGSCAADASLALDDRGRVALTWVTRDTVGADLWLSVSADSGAHWGAALRVNTRPGKVSSHPESRPVATWDRSGMLVVAWAAARDSGQYADDIAVRVSADGGRGFGDVTLVNSDHTDSLSTHHGFAALVMLPDGRPYVAWIDGRSQAGIGDEPTRAEIRASTSRDGGATWTADTLIARDVCPCCHIALASSMRESGAIDVALAYRGAAADMRDPRLAVSHDGGDTFAIDTLVSADRWKLPGCPSVGPALTLDMGGGHYAWFTSESPDDDSLNAVSTRPAPGVYLVPWRIDAGATGPKRARRFAWRAVSAGARTPRKWHAGRRDRSSRERVRTQGARSAPAQAGRRAVAMALPGKWREKRRDRRPGRPRGVGRVDRGRRARHACARGEAHGAVAPTVPASGCVGPQAR